MTPSYASSPSSAGRDPRRAAALVATACVLQVAESLIPHPVPGVRLGLANIITLVTLVESGFAAALEVALLRTVVASLVLGSFLTPGFILSFFSAAASTAVMWALWTVSSRFPRWGLSLAGVSVAGAAAHNAAQLYLAYLLMVRHTGIFYFAPWLAITAVITGWLSALVAAEVMSGSALGLRSLSPVPPAPSPAAAVGLRSPVRRLAPELKIAGTAALLLLAVSARTLEGLLPAAVALLAVMAFSGLTAAEYRALLKKLSGLSWLALASFCFPLLFGAGAFGAAREGLLAGSLLAARILLMGCAGFLLNFCASPAEIAEGIAVLGRPFRRFGFHAERAGAIIGMAWGDIPGSSSRARAAARSALAAGNWRRGPVRWSVGLAAGVIAGMCAPAAESEVFGSTAL